MLRLPPGWNEEHDKFACYCEALGHLDPDNIVKCIKDRFPEMSRAALSVTCISRRVWSLDEQMNDYFVTGMEQAVARAEQAGHIIPPFDDTIYVRKVEKSPSRAAGTNEGPSSGKKTTMAKSEIQEAETPITIEGKCVKKKVSKATSITQQKESYNAVTTEQAIPMNNLKESVINKATESQTPNNRLSTVSLLKPNVYIPISRKPIQGLNVTDSANYGGSMHDDENHHYKIPIHHKSLPASGTSAFLGRPGLKETGSVASLNYTTDAATSSYFDAVGFATPRSSPTPASPGSGFSSRLGTNKTPRSALARSPIRVISADSQASASSKLRLSELS